MQIVFSKKITTQYPRPICCYCKLILILLHTRGGSMSFSFECGCADEYELSDTMWLSKLDLVHLECSNICAIKKPGPHEEIMSSVQSSRWVFKLQPVLPRQDSEGVFTWEYLSQRIIPSHLVLPPKGTDITSRPWYSLSAFLTCRLMSVIKLLHTIKFGSN